MRSADTGIAHGATPWNAIVRAKITNKAKNTHQNLPPRPGTGHPAEKKRANTKRVKRRKSGRAARPAAATLMRSSSCCSAWRPSGCGSRSSAGNRRSSKKPTKPQKKNGESIITN